MLVEKYIVIGIKHPKEVITDVVKQSSYNSLIDPISVIRENKNDIFVDFFGNIFTTKNEAFQRIQEIQKNVSDVMYWSVLPTVVEVSVQEARYLKLKKLKKRIK
jgi:hypothetical protein